MENEPYSDKMLDVSTTHFKQSTLNWLRDETESDEYDSFIVYPKQGYGFFIPIFDFEEGDLEGVPNDLMTVLNFAEGIECTWIMIEVDGCIINQLPAYKADTCIRPGEQL